MWNYSILAMNKELAEQLKKYGMISGIIFILLGLVGIFYPMIMSISTVVLVSYLMLTMGIISAWMTWKSNPKDWAGWLKSTLLIVVALLMLFYPLEGVASLGLLFAMYFLVDSFASFGLAFSLKPAKGWWIWLLNGLTSLLLAALFLYGWPFSSLYLVGLYVGISFLFDGISLIAGSLAIDKLEKEAGAE